jgi:hypothetical protein
MSPPEQAIILWPAKTGLYGVNAIPLHDTIRKKSALILTPARPRVYLMIGVSGVVDQ